MLLNQVISARLTAKQTGDLVDMYLETPSIQDAVNEGEATSQKVQAQKVPSRRCDLCGDAHSIYEIMFIAIDKHCYASIITLLEQIQKEGEKDNGNRSSMVDDRTVETSM